MDALGGSVEVVESSITALREAVEGEGGGCALREPVERLVRSWEALRASLSTALGGTSTDVPHRGAEGEETSDKNSLGQEELASDLAIEGVVEGEGSGRGTDTPPARPRPPEDSDLISKKADLLNRLSELGNGNGSVEMDTPTSLTAQTAVGTAVLSGAGDGQPGDGAGEATSVTEGAAQAVGGSGSNHGDEYQLIENLTLYYHQTTGYLYDPVSQQFYMPTSSASDQSAIDNQGATVENTGQTGGETSQTGDIASVLAVASDRVMEKCGYVFNETVGMYYDARLGLYYDHDSQLYYDADSGTYYTYDPENQKYEIHSRVKLPPKKKEPSPERDDDVIDLCSSSSSHDSKEDSPEEGEIRPVKRRRLPSYSPPPEDEWAPAIRMVVTSSKVLSTGTMFLVTQEGASIGREARGPNPIKIPEVQVSKDHAHISYSRRRGKYKIVDEGSRNGTFLNERRLGEGKGPSKPRLLRHGNTMTVGTTTLSLHIHTGLETCAGCDPGLSGEGGEGGGGGGGSQISAPPCLALDVQRRKELNRIKKRFGLRMKDTYREEPATLAAGYSDRANSRRKIVGSDQPEGSYPDDVPSSVDRPLSEGNVGRKLLTKMGWAEGQGLGRANAGITEPVIAEVRDKKAGLGAEYSKRDIGVAMAATASSSVRHQRMLKHFAQVVSREKPGKQGR